ncbi:MAG: hypothetical protein M0P05_02590 [Candidatus Colwellbacteria bacterium]|nr:hypothetical protein [Candidatus Colwellbacteria bacterium]
MCSLKEYDLDKMKEHAQKIIDKNGKFLLVYDVIGSRRWFSEMGYEKAYLCIREFCKEINSRFKEFIVSGEIGCGKTISCFDILLGDSGGGFFADVSVIGRIVNLAKETLSFEMYWCAGEDGWDEDIKNAVC